MFILPFEQFYWFIYILALCWLMQIDINEGRSRAFNIFLRFLQLGLSCVVAIETAKLDNNKCSTQFYKLVEITSIALTLISLVGNLYFRCRDGFNKTFFFILLAICIVISAIMLIVSFAGYGADNVCPGNKTVFRFIVIETIAIILMNLLVLFGAFFWVQRYSNSPGNIVWAFMFLSYTWHNAYSTIMIFLGVLSIIISIVTLVVNGVAGLYGITTVIKKVIVGSWMLCLVIMLAEEIMAIVCYMQNSDYRDYNDLMAKKLLLIFIIVNMIEFLLWLFGLLTLQHENGDKIRDDMLAFGHTAPEEEHRWSEEDGRGIGTLK